MAKYFFTQEGLEKIKEELRSLKETKQKEISELIKEAVSFGDLKENAAYHDAKDRELFLRMKIAELEEKIKNAEIITAKTILISLNGKERKINLGTDISYESPLGKAISGKKEGETAEFEVNGKKIIVKIIKVMPKKEYKNLKIVVR